MVTFRPVATRHLLPVWPVAVLCVLVPTGFTATVPDNNGAGG